MTYHEAKTYLESFINWESHLQQASRDTFKLERVQCLLETLGNPQKKLKTIHIAGSKGKGSTAALTAKILHEAGYEVGLYTSPHLYDWKERIRILGSVNPDDFLFGDTITEESLASCASAIKDALEKIPASKNLGAFTFFEVFTAMALYYFASEGVDWVVLETGLGGRLDATNAVPSQVCAITPISLEHTQILGDTLESIAQEKAAIIKDKRQKVVIAPQEKSVSEVIRQRCEEFEIKPLQTDEHFQYKRISQNSDGQEVSIKSKAARYSLTLGALGQHQIVNATVAIGIIECLQAIGHSIGPGAIKAACKNVFWPGRFEIIAAQPTIILDGAHNDASMKALVQTVKEMFPGKNITLVLGFSSDKNIQAIVDVLKLPIKNVIGTRADNPRAHDFTQRELEDLFPGIKCYLTREVSEAFDCAAKNCGPDEIILITGSLFVVSEARKLCFDSIRT